MVRLRPATVMTAFQISSLAAYFEGRTAGAGLQAVGSRAHAVSTSTASAAISRRDQSSRIACYRHLPAAKRRIRLLGRISPPEMEHRLPAVGYGDLLALRLADGGRRHPRMHRQATWP